jgi:threonine/homoserine/homoserine lactone efflux protein
VTAFEAVREGYLAEFTNPKVMVFFASVFAAMLSRAMPAGLKLAVLLLIALDEGLWYCSLALLFSMSYAQSAYLRAKRPVDGVASAVRFLLAGKLIWNWNAAQG